ncbi:MAG: EamA family transporter, partial [Alcaligenes sp.]
LASVLLPYCWIQGITRLGPARCSLFLNILPFMTAMLAIPLLGETLGAHHVSGGLLTLTGVILAQWPPQRWLFKTKPVVAE